MSHSVVPPFPRALRHRILSALVAASAIAAAPGSPLQPQTASIEIDAGTQEGRISPLLYGQFAEFMFEGIKGGLHAELIRNRSFEEPPNAIGISRHWERYPDDRNDDYAISFHWDQEVAYPMQAPSEGLIGGHSLRVQLRPGVIARHGVHQARMPITSGLDYRGYLWIRADSFKGDVRVALEADVTGGQIYDEAHIVRGRRRLEAISVHVEAGRQ